MGVYRASKLPVDPGPAAWNEILPEAGAYPQLEADEVCDFLVIGAGFAGLSAARRLQELSSAARIMVIDATRVGAGPAGRNSGFMIDLPHDLASGQYGSRLARDREQIGLNRQAIAFAKRMASEFGMPSEAVVARGRINGAASESGTRHNRDYAAHLEDLGEAFEVLDGRAMREVTGSDFYSGGLYLPGAVLLQPALYIRSLASGIVSQGGVSLYENTAALSIKRADADWRVATPKGVITTPKIILAVNGHAESFGFFRGRLMHIFTYGSMTAPLSREQVKALGGRESWGITPAEPMGSTVRKIVSGARRGEGGDVRIVVRNRWSYEPSMQVSEAQVRRYSASQDKGFRRRFPHLSSVEMAYRWSGRLCLSYNSAPAYGMVDEGIISACCQNGLGTAKGTLSGLAAAELALGLSTPLVGAMLSAGSPSRLPPAPLAWLGASAMIRVREWKGRREI